jgi:hypothetical protein
MSRTIALKTVEVAKRYLNVREDGENRGDDVEMFQKMAVPPLTPGSPYCAAFVRACMKIAATELNTTYVAGFPRSGYTPDWERYAKANSLWIPRAQLAMDHTPARRGDLALFYSRTKCRIAHIGIVTQSFENGVWTIEGNTGPEPSDVTEINRDGDGVYRKMREWNELGQFGGILRVNF